MGFNYIVFLIVVYKYLIRDHIPIQDAVLYHVSAGNARDAVVKALKEKWESMIHPALGLVVMVLDDATIEPETDGIDGMEYRR